MNTRMQIVNCQQSLYLYPNKSCMAKQVEDFDANLAGEEGKTEETKTSWFKRIKTGINTKTSEKRNSRRALDQMP